MVFPSLPFYQDPLTWNQQQQQEEQIHPPPNGGSARPNSMAERARLAKIPQPEQALKCPRCESTNTKFCYFNNYSLSQPRHFCKACRRYWTRGGAMRNVPVGGGCRRNSKRSSKPSGSGGSSAKTFSATATECQGGASSFTTTSAGIATSSPFMATLQPMMDYINNVHNLGLGNVDYQQVGSATTNTTTTTTSSMDLEQWRLNQIQPFPFLGGLDPQLPPIGIGNTYPFNGALSSLEMKTEDNSRGLDLARNYNSSVNLRNDQLWVGNNSGGGSSSGWMTNLFGFNSSSTGSLL